MLVVTEPDAVHVGLHKTGTTWLQREFYPKISKRVMSNEMLSGFPVVSSLDLMLKHNLREYYADCIKKQFGDVKIIVGIRNIDSLAKSLYSQYLKAGGTDPYSIWRVMTLDHRYLDYKPYIRYLKDNFTDVYIYTFEDLNNNKKDCLKSLCDFLDCDYPSDIVDTRHNTGLYGFTAFKKWLNNNILVFKRFLDDKH